MTGDGRPGGTSRVDLAGRLARRRLIVCCGSGGVGKTTVSAALGMALVAEHDMRVLVLTVDPARRLATALGLTSMGADPVTIDPHHLRRAGIEPVGELVVAMLDMKSTWDRLVERYAPDPATARRIVSNRFYQGLSGAFIGSHEYMAMEALYELHAAGEYDCLVIDTPPTRNALDFLEAPDRLVDFVGGRLLAWLAKPTRFGLRAMNFAATPFLRMADRLLGAEMLEELAAFVADVQGMYPGVQARARQVYQLLRSPTTAFLVVTTLEPPAFAEAEYFCERLREFSMPLRAVVVNRVLGGDLSSDEATALANRLTEDGVSLEALQRDLGVAVPFDVARRAGAGFLSLHERARRDARQLDRLSRLGGVPVAHVPLAPRDVSDLESLAEIARALRGA